MPDLSPIAREVWDELQPVLADLARMKGGGDSGIALDQGKVLSIDRETGRCTVTLDSGAVGADATCATYLPSPRERVWVQFVKPFGYMVVGRVRGTPVLLGPPGILTVPLALDIPGTTLCSTVVQVQANRHVVVWGHVQVLDGTAGAQATSAWIERDGVFVETVGRRDLVANGSETIDGHVLDPSPAAGLHTYSLVASMSAGPGTAQADVLGVSPGPATVFALDVGSANS